MGDVCADESRAGRQYGLTARSTTQRGILSMQSVPFSPSSKVSGARQTLGWHCFSNMHDYKHF